jgi:hypothetical protein
MKAAQTRGASVCSRPCRSPISSIAIAGLVGMFSGCTTPYQGDAAQGGAYSNDMAADTPLREVYVLGSVRNAYAPSNTPLDPMLNPRTPPPAFKEADGLTAGCAVGTTPGPLDDQGATLMDEGRFQQLMGMGLKIAQARQVWKFNQQRYEAQLKTVSGPRTMGRNDRAVAPRPSGARPSAAPTRPDAAIREAVRDMFGFLKPAAPQPSVADQLNKQLPDFDKMRQDLAYNAQVLAAQNEALSTQERQYAEELFALYKDAFVRLSQAPPHRISLAALNRFDGFRYRHIFACVQRGEPTAKTKEIAQAVSDQYEPLAQKVIESNRDLILKAIKAAKRSSDLQAVYQDLLGTVFLKDVAAQDPVLSQSMQQRSTALLAQEAREREEAMQRASAEVARQAALLQKKYAQNAARNAAPTVDDVAALLSAYDAEINEQYRSFRIERTGADSFTYYARVPFLGEFKAGEIEAGVGELTCKPEQGRQRCAFSENRMVTDYHLGLFTERHPSEFSGQAHDAVFYWDASGLHSPQLKAGMVERMKKLLERLAAELAASQERAAASSRKTCTRYYRQFGTQSSSYEDCH